MREYTALDGIVWTIAPWPDKPGSGDGPEGHGGMPRGGLMFQSSVGWFLVNLHDAGPYDLSDRDVQHRIDRWNGADPGARERSSGG